VRNTVWVATALALAASLTACTSDQGEPHVGEIYDSVEVAQSEKFPGDAELTRQAGACEKSFEDFIGKPYAESTLKINYFHPTTESWERGDREILCIVENPAGTVVGSLKGTGR
jgi:hypothetical protein